MTTHSGNNQLAQTPRGSLFLARILASGFAVVATLLVGIVAYWLWVLVGAYLSLNRQLSGGGATDSSSAAAMRWLDGALFLSASCGVTAAVRAALIWIGRRARWHDVCFTGLAVGAIIGVLAAMFLNHNLRLSPWPHLFVDVPEISVGRFWPLASALGVGFSFIGSLAGPRTLAE
jgi:hypothetical protein